MAEINDTGDTKAGFAAVVDQVASVKTEVGGVADEVAGLRDVVEESVRAEADHINVMIDAQKEAAGDAKALSEMSDEKREASMASFREQNAELLRPKPDPLTQLKPSYFKKIGEFMALPIGEKFKFLQEKGGAAGKELRDRARKLREKTVDRLDKIYEGIKGMAKRAKDAIKSKLPSMSTMLMMGVAGAILALMNTPAMKALKDFILDEVIPVIAELWKKVIKPALESTVKYFKEIWPDLKKGILELVELGKEFYKKHLHPILVAWKDKFVTLFEDFKVFLKDPSWDKFAYLIWDNKIAVATIVGLLAPKLLFGGLLKAVKLIGPAISLAKGWIGVPGMIGTATVLAYAFAAASAARALSISMDTYAEELKKGKPAIDALGTASREWVAEFLGWPANFVKDAASWAAGALGYSRLEKELDRTDMRDVIKMGVDGWVLLFKKSFKGWGNIIKGILDIDWKGFIRYMMGTGKVSKWITKNIFRVGTVEEEAALDAEAAVKEEAEKQSRLLRNKEMRIFAVRAGIRSLEKDVAVDSLLETDTEIKEEKEKLERLRKEIIRLEQSFEEMKKGGPTIIGGDISQVDARSSTSVHTTSLENPNRNLWNLIGAL